MCKMSDHLLGDSSPRQDGEGEDDFYRETFRAMDVNKDGAVDIDEFQLGFAKTKADLSTAFLRRAFEMGDANDDGVLDEDEFVALMKGGEMQEFFLGEQDREDEMIVTEFREVYGQCPALRETEPMVREAVSEMKSELEAIPDKGKRALIQAREECPELADELLIAFLRCDLFEPSLAARRCVKYWERRLRVFGPDKAFRPLTLENIFGEEDPAELLIGHERLTGVKDPEGRPLVYIDYTVEDKRKYEHMTFVRSWWYVLHAVLEGEDAQRHGVIFYVNNKIDYLLLKADFSLTYEMCGSLAGAIPLRLVAVHMCRPHAKIAWILSLGKLYLGPNLRNRIHVHTDMEDALLLRGLTIYGLTPDMVPSVWGGDLELPDHAQWIRDRRKRGR